MALLLLCCVAIVAFLPVTVPEQQSMDSWLMVDAAAQAAAPRRITPKSIFIAPSFSHAALPACAEGYRPDAMGRCVKVVRVNQAAQLDFLLRRLNNLYAAPPVPPPPVDSSGPLQVSLPIEQVTADPSPGSSVEVALVLADVVKDNHTDTHVPQTMLAVWNISRNTTSNSSLATVSENLDGASVRAANSSRINTTQFVSGLSLPEVEETIPIVMQTPPSTLVIQDLPGSDTVSRPLSSEVDFDIPYYDYYQDQDTTERRCLYPPCKDSFTEINSRSPHVPDTSFLTSSETQSESAMDYNVTEPTISSLDADVGESDTDSYVFSTELTFQRNISDAVIVQNESEAFSNKLDVLPVVNDTEVDIVDSVINATVSLSRSNMNEALPEVYVGNFETSAELSVKHTAEQVREAEEKMFNSTDVVSRGNTSGIPVLETLPKLNVTDSKIVNTKAENVPKKSIVLPEESLLIGTSMDPLSDVNVAGNEESSLAETLDTTEQRSPAPEDHHVLSTPSVRFPSGAGDIVADAKSNRMRFPGAVESRVVFPDDRTNLWWLPSGWKLDQSRHHPVLLRFWRKMPEAYLPDHRPLPQTSRHHHVSQFYQTYGDG